MSSDRSCSEQSDLFLIRLRIYRVHEGIICILRALPVRIRFGVADPPITILPGEVRWLKEGRISTPPGLPVALMDRRPFTHHCHTPPAHCAMADRGRSTDRDPRPSNSHHLPATSPSSGRQYQTRSQSLGRHGVTVDRPYYSDNERTNRMPSSRPPVRVPDQARASDPSVHTRQPHPQPPKPAPSINVQDWDRGTQISTSHRYAVPTVRPPQPDYQSLVQQSAGLKPPDTHKSNGALAPAQVANHSSSNHHRRYSMPSEQDLRELFPQAGPSVPRRWAPVEASGSRSTRSETTRASYGTTTIASGEIGATTYRYAVLEKNHFRLVKILRKSMSTLSCEISHHRLETSQKYTAISYAWGDGIEKDTIKLEKTTRDEHGRSLRKEIPVAVPISLHGALNVLRQAHDDVYVWVDALCIDQKNTLERSEQVQLMSDIYGRAHQVAIWLGPGLNYGAAAVRLIRDLAAAKANAPALIADHSRRKDFTALVSLFERDYWKRLWVVQEVFIPKPEKIMVYCGDSKLDWTTYRTASYALRKHKRLIEHCFPGGQDHSGGHRTSQHQLSYSQVLESQGPGSLLDQSYKQLELLDIMRQVREKLSARPLDKVYGILGLLHADIRKHFTVDYDLSVKELYINVVDHIVSNTGRLDVIREAIHYPVYTGSADLPSWCPDWSHIPMIKALPNTVIPNTRSFSASGNHIRGPEILGHRRNLKIFAIPLDYVDVRGVAVGTLTSAIDYLMAFLNWRAILHAAFEKELKHPDTRKQLLESFSQTMSLNQAKTSLQDQTRSWSTVCHHVFGSLIRARLPKLSIDDELRQYSDMPGIVRPADRRTILQRSFGDHMMGRSFCLTRDKRLMCMGSGFMRTGDIVVVALGSSTPLILRPEAGEYRYVGDIYVHGYMYGDFLEPWTEKQNQVREYVLH
jgi:hypothetical protein